MRPAAHALVATLAPALANTGCGGARADLPAARRTLVVAVGADEFPLTIGADRPAAVVA